ncbi:heme oxygenase-like protein [Gracilaria domingensis]|nr:heme oxygenase-like protein [Gracilaria domingensis]
MPNRRQRASVASSSAPALKKDDQGQTILPESSEKQARMVDQWILKYHIEWSGLTLNPFYHELTTNMISPAQYARWLLDRASISLAIVEGAKRTADIVRNSIPGTQFPLLRIAAEDARHFTEIALLAGLDINSAFRLSAPARQLVQLLDASTAPDAPPAVAVTAVWGFMLASWQAWDLCLARVESLPPEFENVAKQITRQEALKGILDTERVLERLLKSADSSDQFEKAGKTFEEVAKRAKSVLEYTMFISDSSNIPVCTCGRKGHYPEQCTFKSPFP